MQIKKILLWVIGGVVLFVIAIATIVVAMVYVKKANVAKLRGPVMYGMSQSIAEKAAYVGPADTLSRQMTQAGRDINIPTVRKLIKRAELNLQVKNCEETAQKIINIADSFSGIITDSQIQKYQNESKRGWTVIKVNPKDFNIVLAKLKELGKLDSERVTGEDITEEYIDLEARLKNFQVVKARLLKILDEKAREVKDILEVERELSRVSEQIEVIEGRMKYLDRQVGLATINVNYYEAKALAPESINVFKRFKETIRTAIEAFINVFNAAIVVIAAILPILIWVFVISVIVILVRKLFRK